MVESYMFSDIS